MAFASYLEDILEQLAQNLPEEEIRSRLSQVGWRPEHTKIVTTSPRKSDESVASPSTLPSSEGAREMLKQFLTSVVHQLRTAREEVGDLKARLAMQDAEIKRLIAARDREAERSRRLQTKLKEISTTRTHR